MKNRILLQTIALLVSFVFLSSTSIAATSDNSFPINDMTSNLWSFVPSSGGSWDTVKDQLHYLPGKSGYLFFVGSDEELDFLKAIGDEIDALFPNSRILGMENVVPLTHLELMSDGDYHPIKIDFVDEDKTVVASWDFEKESWVYYGDFDSNGNRLALNSEGESRMITNPELTSYENTPYSDLIIKSGLDGKEALPFVALEKQMASDGGSSKPKAKEGWKPHSHLGEDAMKAKVPAKLDKEIEAAKKSGIKTPPRTGLAKAAADPKIPDLDKAIRRAKIRGRVITWGTIGIVVVGLGGLGIYAYLNNKAVKERNAERQRLNEERQAAEKAAIDSLNAAQADSAAAAASKTNTGKSKK